MFKPKLQDLKNELFYICGYSTERIEDMTRYEMFDAWLKYHGIIDYTDDIITMLTNAIDNKLVNKLKNELFYICGYSTERIEDMTRYEMFDAWLKYHGIIDYTDDIITMLSNAIGINLANKL